MLPTVPTVIHLLHIWHCEGERSAIDGYRASLGLRTHWRGGSLTRRTEEANTGKIIKYLPVWRVEHFITSLVELPASAAGPATVSDPGPALAVSPHSILPLGQLSMAVVNSAVAWRQWPTAKVKVEAGMGIVT